MEVFKDVTNKCKKDDGFEHERYVSYSCGDIFTITESDVYAISSPNYFDEDVVDFYAICPKCGYGKNDRIIDLNAKNYYMTIVNVQCPIFIFICFELSYENDVYNENNELNYINTINLLC